MRRIDTALPHLPAARSYSRPTTIRARDPGRDDCMTAHFPGPAFAAQAAAQVDQAMRSLAQRRNRHSAIHRMRKAIRRLRSLLALCRPGLGPETDVIDKGLRQLCVDLSDLRDAHVVVVTASGLALDGGQDTWPAAVVQLAARREKLLSKALAADPEFASRRARLDTLAQAIAALPWHRLDDSDLAEGIARSARRLVKAERKARQEPGADSSHHWRRRLRRLRMQYQVIRAARKRQPSWKGPPRDPHRASIHALNRQSDRLGRIQDLHMLGTHLKRIDVPPAVRKRMRDQLRAEIDRASR